METKEITDRVINLLEPTLTDTIEELRVEETDYFIHHLTLDLQRSLYNWKLKSAKNK